MAKPPRLFKSLAAVGLSLWLGPMVGDWAAFAAFDAGTFVGSELLVGSIAQGAAQGFISSPVATGGDVKAAFQGAFTGGLSCGLFNAAGQVGASFGDGKFAHFAAHAGAGCLTAVAQGGKCDQGAVSAMASKFATIQLRGTSDSTQLVGTVVAGGTTSYLGGGKFCNGAQSALYGYLFNEMLTRTDGTRYKSAGYRYDGDESRLTFKAANIEKLMYIGYKYSVFPNELSWENSDEVSYGVVKSKFALEVGVES